MKSIRYALLLLPLLGMLEGCKSGGWGGGFSMPPAMVETAAASMQPVEDRFETVGSLEAEDAVTIVSEIGGILVAVPFAEGGRVSRGSLIAQLDDRELKADLDRATAVRDQAQLTFDRTKTIVEQGAGAKQNLDEAEAALKVAAANAASAQARFAKTRITAPFDGVVGARRVSPGAYVQPGTEITDLARLDNLRVKFSAPERFLAQLKRGSDVTVSTTAYPGQELTGTIEVLEPQIDPRTRSVGVVARISNPEGRLRPGMSANVAAVLRERAAALTIPSEAVVMDQNQPVVYVIKPDCTVARTVVQLGARMREIVEVMNGLKEGERIVRAGHQKVFEGAKVIPVSSADSLSAGHDSATARGATP